MVKKVAGRLLRWLVAGLVAGLWLYLMPHGM